MTINDTIETQMSKFRMMKARIGWKEEAKERYKKHKGNIAKKPACSHCEGMAENIADGDTVAVVKRNPRMFCTDSWHETVGTIQNIYSETKKMLYIGYENLLAGFTVTKICPHCQRIICVKEF